jgi:hypothetical protein
VLQYRCISFEKFSAFCGGPEEGRYSARAAVRLLSTKEPAPKEGDSWAQAPVSESGLLVSTEAKRYTTTGSGVLLTRQTGPLLLVEVKRRTTASNGVLLTRWFTFAAHGG